MRFSEVEIGQHFTHKMNHYVRINDTVEITKDKFNAVCISGDFAGHLDWFSINDECEFFNFESITKLNTLCTKWYKAASDEV